MDYSKVSVSSDSEGTPERVNVADIIIISSEFKVSRSTANSIHVSK